VITFAGGHQVLTFAGHGVGLIICPDPARDRAYPAQTSLHAEEWRTVLNRLRAAGWELVQTEDGERHHVGATMDGRAAYLLTSPASANTGSPATGSTAATPDAVQRRAAIIELCVAARVVPLPGRNN
jgi:hypothetical protein